MNTKQGIVGTIVGGLVVLMLGYIIWDMLFAEFFAANSGSATGVDKEQQVVWAVALGAFAYAALIMYALAPRAGSMTIVNGAITGAIVGFLLWCTADLTWYGVTNINNLTATVADPLLELVRGAITGAVLAVLVPKLA